MTAHYEQLDDRRAAFVSATARDPRAARVITRTNVSVPETCQYYGVADAISRCRVPRSCQDCLAMPGCGISSYGQCQNATAESGRYFAYYDHDYRTGNFSAGSLISNTSSFYFLAGTATYCAATDPVCTKCRDAFQRLATSPSRSYSTYLGTQFCKGDNGCVCIGVCEVPQEFQQRTRDWQCDQPSFYSKNLPKIEREPHGGGRGDPRAPVVKIATTSKKEETCAYTKEVDLRGCRKPRTCQDCLSKPGCAISRAKCTDEYSWSQDFRTATLDSNNRSSSYSGNSFYFPSSNTTYCPASDSTCANCLLNSWSHNSYDWYSAVSYSGFCVGQNGCVCIDACHDPRWSTEVYDEECNRSDSYGRPHSASPVGSLVIAGFAWIALYFAHKISTSKSTPSTQRRRGQGQSGPRMLRHMLDEAPSVIRMNLSGWRGDHERLREREERVLRGEDLEAAPRASDTNCGSVDDATIADSSRNASSTDLDESNTELQPVSRGDSVRRRFGRNV